MAYDMLSSPFWTCLPFHSAFDATGWAGTISSRYERRFPDNPQSTDEHDQSLKSKDYRKSNKRANDASHRPGDATTVTRVGVGRCRGAVAAGGAGPIGVAANLAPLLGILDSDSAHTRLKVVPADSTVCMVEQWINCEWMLSSGAVDKVEPDGNVVGARMWSGGVGDELESHGGGVVDDGSKVSANRSEVGRAEEGGEGAIGAELDVQGRCLLPGNDGAEGVKDLASQDKAGYGADGVGSVVSQVPLVDTGKLIELSKGVAADETSRGDCGIVDLSHIDIIENLRKSARKATGGKRGREERQLTSVSIHEIGLRLVKGSIDDRK